MKKFKIIVTVVFIALQISVNAQEKKIKFNTGTLKICSSKNFKIKGYNGNEVIIKSLHDKKYFYSNITNLNNQKSYQNLNEVVNISKKLTSLSKRKIDSLNPRVFFSTNNSSQREGLKRLGKKQENQDYGIYFTIEEKNGELVFSDNNQEGAFRMFSNESYEIMIPNSIKLNWDTNGCKDKSKQKSYAIFYDSKASSLSDFDGEVEISTSLNNLKLKDLTGPVSINSIGGNVTVEFDKKTPKKLYSIYSNNGFIDIKLPSSSNVSIDANAASIFSDLNFSVVEDTEKEGLQNMKLKMNSGKVKMKLNAGLGSIYLRKK
jgi:hypothetical protein